MEIRSSPNFMWHIKDVLGQGATGAVYKGRDKKTGNEVAIKVTNHLGMMRPLDVRKREFEVLNRLDHENIVRIFASENELRSQNEIIAMELCSGGSLYTLLEHPSNSYGFSEKDCKDIIRDVVAGMEHLRNQGIVHRDLKPGNIMRVFNDDGTCSYKLTDFGAARELEHSAEQFMSVYGTEEYLHPDLYERGVLRKSSGKTFGANVDLWSIGVTFYHIATGKLPFRPQGGRQNKDTMYHITTAKASGMIAGVQRISDGVIEWSDKLPDHTNLSRGFQDLLVPILAGVLESDPSKMMSFGEFFRRVQDMVTRKVVSVYHVQTSSFHEIYIPPTAQFEAFQELIFKETGLPPAHQKLFVNGEAFKRSHATDTAEKFPSTSRENPMILVGGEFVLPEDLTPRKIPIVTKLQKDYTLESDAAAAKIRANCAHACKVSTLFYTQVVNVMCISLNTTVKSLKNDLLKALADCGKVEGRRTTASHMTTVCCNSQVHFMTLLERLMSHIKLSDGEKSSIEDEFTMIKHSIQNKRQSNQELDKVKDFIEKIKVLQCDFVENDTYASSLSTFCKQARGKSLFPLVSSLTSKIEDIYIRYRKDKHLRRLPYAEEQNHNFDRKRLGQLTGQVTDATNQMFDHRVKTYHNFIDLYKEVDLYQTEACRLKDQLLRIAPADEAHVVTLEAFQNECQEKYQSILTRLCEAMKTVAVPSSSSVGTDLPSLGLPSNGISEEAMSEQMLQEMERHMKTLYDATEFSNKTAKENGSQLKELTDSFTEFYKLLAESGTRTLNDLKVLQEVSAPLSPVSPE